MKGHKRVMCTFSLNENRKHGVIFFMFWCQDGVLWSG